MSLHIVGAEPTFNLWHKVWTGWGLLFSSNRENKLKWRVVWEVRHDMIGSCPIHLQSHYRVNWCVICMGHDPVRENKIYPFRVLDIDFCNSQFWSGDIAHPCLIDILFILIFDSNKCVQIWSWYPFIHIRFTAHAFPLLWWGVFYIWNRSGRLRQGKYGLYRVFHA